MLLLSRPPYLRWAAAVLLVVGALLWDLHGRRTEPYPFAAADLAAGMAITPDIVEWRDVPAGLLPPFDLDAATAVAKIGEGEPLTPSVVGSGSVVPDGWWSVPVVLPVDLGVGQRVRLYMAELGSVDGIVSGAAVEDRFGVTSTGSVAVAPEHADMVAAAATSNSIVVLVAP